MFGVVIELHFGEWFPGSEGTIVLARWRGDLGTCAFDSGLRGGTEGWNTTGVRAFFPDWPENQNGGS